MRPYDHTCRRQVPRVSSSQEATSKASRADRGDAITCSQCAKSFSQKHQLQRHMKEHRWFGCAYGGCSYSTRQRNNLTVHTKTHTGEKDQFCTWPDPSTATGLCGFTCGDPSSLNRHTKRHVARAEREGKPVPARKSKRPSHFNPIWIRVEPGFSDSQGYKFTKLAGPRKHYDPPSPSSTDSEEIQESCSVLSQSPRLPQRLDSSCNADPTIERAQNPLRNFPEVAASIDHHIPSASETGSPLPGSHCSGEQPQVQQSRSGKRRCDDTWFDYLPNEYLVDWPVLDRFEPQSLPAPSIESVLDSNTLHALSILEFHLDQLRPLLTTAQYPLSFLEVEAALFRLAECDGIFPETFLGLSSSNPLLSE